MGGPGGFASSFRKDSSVVDHRIAKGTVPRVVAYARPFFGQIAAYLALTIVSSLLVVATPLLLQRLIDDGVANKNTGLVIILASIVALLAIPSNRSAIVLPRSSASSRNVRRYQPIPRRR